MATRSLGQLTLDLLLKIGGFQKGADQAARASDKMRRKMEADAKAITGAFKSIGATIGAGFSVAALVTGLTSAASAAIEYGDEIGKAAAKTGITVEEMQTLAKVAQLNDIELTQLTTAFKKMQVTISEAASGTKAAQETLAALGLTVEELKKQTPDQQFETLAGRIAALKDPADRARAAVELFGKAGADLLPLFEDGAEGIRKAREQMDGVLSEEQIKALQETDDAIKRLNQSWHDVAHTLTAEVAPGLTAAFNEANKVLKGEGWLAQYLKLIAGGPTGAVRGLALMFGPESPAPPEKLLGTSRVAVRPKVPGFTDTAAAEAAKREAEKAAADAAREAEKRAREQAQAVKDLADEYKTLLEAAQEAMDATRTEGEVALDLLKERRAVLERAAKELPGMAADAQAAIAKLEQQFLDEPIEIPAHIIIPPEGKKEFDAFLDEAQRNTQDIIADALISGFDDGVDGMLRSFARMLLEMEAQALAAQIGKAIFSGSWITKAASIFAGFFESGGFIPPGQVGVVGESGPELVMGGRAGQTVVPMTQAGAAPQVHLRNINAFDTGVIRDYLLSAQGEQVILNFISRNGARVRMASAGR